MRLENEKYSEGVNISGVNLLGVKFPGGELSRE